MATWSPFPEHEDVYCKDTPRALRSRRFPCIRLIAPSDVVAGTPFDIGVVAIGPAGDVNTSYRGRIAITCSDEPATCPLTYEFREEDRGVGVIRGAVLHTDGFHPLKLKPITGCEAGSIQCVRSHESMPEHRTFWGDIHFHTTLSDGGLSPDEAYQSARDIFRLDLAAAADHDACHRGGRPMGCIGEDHPDFDIEIGWRQTVGTANRFYEPGRFVTLLAYEWTSAGGESGSSFGHRNVYYRADDAPIYPHTHYTTPPQLWEALRRRPGVGNAMTVPHHPILPLVQSGGTDWRYHDPDLERLVEVYSQFGSSEYYGNPRPVSSQRRDGSAQYALTNGYQLGMICATDNHAGKIGSDYTTVRAAYPRGLTAILARDLTREDVWTALWNRRCYGTTGQRIIMDFRINGRPVGSTVKSQEKPFISWAIGANSTITNIRLLRYDGVLAVVEDSSTDMVHTGGFEDTDFDGQAFYYLKATMSNDEMAWAGPIWIQDSKPTAEPPSS